jgi:hypothetical protein
MSVSFPGADLIAGFEKKKNMLTIDTDIDRRGVSF